MKTNLRLISQIFLAILLLGQTLLQAQEQWFPRHLLDCKQRKTNPTESRETAFLRPYPLETKSVNLGINGRNLFQFLATEESLGRSIDRLMRLSSTPTSPDDVQKKESSKNPFFFSSQAYSDCVLIVRGNTAIVFPRFMLLNPFFQQIVIKEDDYIATFSSRENSANAKDPIRDFLVRSKDLDRPANISLIASGSKQGAVETFMDGYRKNAKTGKIAVDVFFVTPLNDDGETFESIAYEPQPADLLDQRLLMLTRVRSGYMIHYLIPFRRSGALGSNGTLTKKAVITPPPPQEPYDVWREQTAGLQSTLLQDGDKISVVTVVSATTEMR